ncbi:MAG: sigma-70 family RNA polymerase sigma factor [Planctomycetes bacterium]|nr:sigma-70 family RNA polymerase sigma factor [Planctomycetota bacterium]
MSRVSAFQEVDDAVLVSRCLSREQGAWDAFLRRHASFVQAESRRQLLRYQGRAEPADVDDACQELFSLLVKDGARVLRQFRSESSLSTWLAHVARSVCRQLSQRRRTFELSPEEPVSLPPPEAALPPEGLAEALARLPARDQKLLRLFFSEGKKYREIAQALGISINSVGPLLARAIAATRRHLAP